MSAQPAAALLLDLDTIDGMLARAERHVDAAKEARMDGVVGALDLASEDLRSLRAALDALRSRERGPTAAALRSCPSCGHRISFEATLCGYCWKRSAAGSAAKP